MEESFTELMKASKNKNLVGKCQKSVSLAILADSASQHLATAIKGYGLLNGFNFEIFDADYNQVEFQIFDDNSELHQRKPEYVVLFLCHQKLYEQFCNSGDRKNFSSAVLNQMEEYYNRLGNLHTTVIQPLFLEEDDRVFGNFGLKTEDSFLWQVKEINLGLMRLAAERGNVCLFDPNRIVKRMGRTAALDFPQYCNAKLAFSLEALPVFAAEITGIVRARFAVKKCVVLDLDNTLWGGVVGDDGLEGIELGELGIGHAFCDFQLWLRELKRRGILLCVCSKNDEDTAREPFEKHPDMVLSLEDITVFVANWEDKATNIRKIQQTLKIGMDSMVFLDDSPYERELVRSMIPEIAVPDLPGDPALYKEYLQSLNLFETVSYSENDGKRTEQYREEAGRVQSRQAFTDFREYLKSLSMVGTARTFEAYYYPRIAQLSQRSNQFNLRTVRYTEDDIAGIAASEDYLTRYYTLRDRFGDYGLVSVVILKKLSAEELFVDTWLMSCRVLKRGMEEYVVNSYVEAAREQGFTRIVGEYVKTPKNAMVEHLYEQFGFKPKGEGRYELLVDEYVPREHFIK